MKIKGNQLIFDAEKIISEPIEVSKHEYFHFLA